MNAINTAPTQQEQVIARLIADLRFDDGALVGQPSPLCARLRARPAAPVDSEDRIETVASRMSPSQDSSRTESASARTVATPLFAAPVARPGQGPEFEMVERDGVPFVRFADGEEFEFDHLDSHDRPVFFGDRASPRVWAANIAFTLAGLGLGIGVVANLQALGGFVSGFLSTVAPTLHL